MDKYIYYSTIIANVASFCTFITAIYYAKKFNEKAIRRENDILKEKEWQVVWADNFLKKAIEFNDSLSSSLVKFTLANMLREDKHKEKAEKLRQISQQEIFRLRELEWDIQNYTTFIEDMEKKKNLKNIQNRLIDFLNELQNSEGVVNLEDFRKEQFYYSILIRDIHSDLLKIKPNQNHFNFSEINFN